MNNVLSRTRQTSPQTPQGGSGLAALVPTGPARFLVVFLVLAVLGATPFLIGSQFGQRALLAILVASVIVPNLFSKPALGVGMLITFLCFMGGIRRWLIPVIGWTTSDPLVLVQAAVTGVMFAWLLLRRGITTETPLARLMTIMLIWMAVESLNGSEGGLVVSLGGIMFTIVPLLWFFYGRMVGSATLLASVFRTIIVVAILAALYGLYQTWFGFTEGELIWMKSLVPFSSLSVGGTIRAISFFTSPAEYTEIMSMAVVILFAAWLKGNKLAWLPVPLLMLALFLESARGPIIYTVAGCAGLWAVQGRHPAAWGPRVAVALVIAAFGMVWSMKQVSEASVGSQTSDLVKHQASGIEDPGSSTAPLHMILFANGILVGIRHPFGRGLGSGTPAASRLAVDLVRYGEVPHLGGDIQQGSSTEVDVSNMFLSLGLVGGILYVVIMFRTFKDTLRYWDLSRSWGALSVLGILTAAAGQWMNGNYYAGSMIVWLCVGIMDKSLQTFTAQDMRRRAIVPPVPIRIAAPEASAS